MKSKNVFLIRNVKPECYGGGETYQLVLAGQLMKYGYSPIIVSSSKKLLSEAKMRGIKAIKAPYFKKQNFSGFRNFLLPVYLIHLMKLKRWYRNLFLEYKPSTINIQSRDDFIAATLAAERMGIKILWTDHMDFRSWVFVNVNIPYKNFIGKMILRFSQRADKVIMISDYEKAKIEEMIAPKKIKNMVVIKNGAIDRLKDFKNVEIKKESFVYVGRIVSYKGVFELISAFLEVIKKYPHAILNIYGEGEDEERCRRLAGSCPQIRFHGYTEEPLKILAENYCFILDSYWEGLSLSLLDAAMMGKVVIASDVDGNPEIVKNRETGLLVPARDICKLKDAMLEVLEKKDLSDKMSKNIRVFYEKNFNFEKIFVKMMLPIYNEKKEEE